MTIEERFEFLFKSIESHDRQLGELTEQIAELRASTAELRASTAELRASTVELRTTMREGFERTQLNFDRLTQAMTGLTDFVADHERRIRGLEGR